jgi:predicted transcriptional regulator
MDAWSLNRQEGRMDDEQTIERVVCLGKLERIILSYLWYRNRAVILKVIVQDINRSERRERSVNTYMTTITRMISKGMVKISDDGRPKTYCASMTREELIALAIGEIESI